MANKTWETYEQVAQFLLNQFSYHFSLDIVEAKQKIRGLQSSTDWEIDAKGILENKEGFLLIECKRYTKSKINQETVGALAYRISDTGAKGGILVTPLELQKGARQVAEHENIRHIILAPQSTTTDHILKFLNQIFVGVSNSLTFNQCIHVQVVRDGKIVKETKI